MRVRRRERRGPARRRAGGLLAAGFIGGVMAGLLVWSFQMRRWSRDLFSPRRLKRLAALGHLAGRSTADVDAVHLLTEYVGWEKDPMLRRRAQRLLHRRKQSFV